MKRSPVKLKLKRTMYIHIRVHSRLSTTGTHMSNGIIQFYLPPDRGDVPAPTPVGAGEVVKGCVDLSRFMRISCSRIFHDDQWAAAELEPMRFA